MLSILHRQDAILSWIDPWRDLHYAQSHWDLLSQMFCTKLNAHDVLHSKGCMPRTPTCLYLKHLLWHRHGPLPMAPASPWQPTTGPSPRLFCCPCCSFSRTWLQGHWLLMLSAWSSWLLKHRAFLLTQKMTSRMFPVLLLFCFKTLPKWISF